MAWFDQFFLSRITSITTFLSLRYQLKVVEKIRLDAKTGRRRKSGKIVEEIDISDAIDFSGSGKESASSSKCLSRVEEVAAHVVARSR